jgi:hypothetical protein
MSLPRSDPALWLLEALTVSCVANDSRIATGERFGVRARVHCPHIFDLQGASGNASESLAVVKRTQLAPSSPPSGSRRNSSHTARWKQSLRIGPHPRSGCSAKAGKRIGACTVFVHTLFGGGRPFDRSWVGKLYSVIQLIQYRKNEMNV